MNRGDLGRAECVLFVYLSGKHLGLYIKILQSPAVGRSDSFTDFTDLFSLGCQVCLEFSNLSAPSGIVFLCVW